MVKQQQIRILKQNNTSKWIYTLIEAFKTIPNKGVKRIDTSAKGVKYTHFIASKLPRVAFQNN